MRFLLPAFFLFLSLAGFSQSFSEFSFSNDGFPVSAAFPGKPSTSFKISGKDTLLTATASFSGKTYSVILTRTGSEEIARRAVLNIPGRLMQKSIQQEPVSGSNIKGINGYTFRYINDKGTSITAWLLSFGSLICQAMVLQKGQFPDAEATQFFESIRLAAVLINTNAFNTAKNDQPSTGVYSVNSRVEVWDQQKMKWYGAIVLKSLPNGLYRVAFDGYADTYDEDVPGTKIRNMTTATIPSFVPFVRTSKGKTTTLKGSLKNGEVLEDLSWAGSSQIACWPGLRDVEFMGKHVGYWFDLPDHSVATITVTPHKKSSRINIYGYTSFDLQRIPPHITYVQTCEASHPVWIGQPNLKEPATPQTIRLNTVTRHTAVYFAVAGAKDVLEGEYTITIEIK